MLCLISDDAYRHQVLLSAGRNSLVFLIVVLAGLKGFILSNLGTKNGQGPSLFVNSTQQLAEAVLFFPNDAFKVIRLPHADSRYILACQALFILLTLRSAWRFRSEWKSDTPRRYFRPRYPAQFNPALRSTLRPLPPATLLPHSVDWIAASNHAFHLSNYELLGGPFLNTLRDASPALISHLLALDEPAPAALHLQPVLLTLKPRFCVLIGLPTAEDNGLLARIGYHPASHEPMLTIYARP